MEPQKITPNLIKKASTGTSLQKCSAKNLIKSENGNKYLSIYNDEQTEHGVISAIARVKMAFPSLDKSFYSILTDRVIEKGMTDKQIMDAVNNVIDTCEYPTPVIGKFLGFDKKKQLYTYAQFAEMNMQGEKLEYFNTTEINGVKYFYRKNE